MFRLSFVCTGNRCRSATAAAIVRDLAGDVVAADSCGVLQLDGAPPPRETIEAARELGVDLSSHRSVWLGDSVLATKDLVLGFERQHLAAAVVEGGAAAERSFTLLEFMRLAERIEPPTAVDPAERAREVVRRAHEARTRDDVFVPGEEIPDPIGRPLQFHRDTARDIAHLCERLIGMLFGAARANRRFQ